MMKNVKIRSRLLIGFAVLLVLLIFVSIFSATRMFYLAESATALYEHPLTVSNAVRDAEINIVNMQRVMREMMMTESNAELEQAVQTVNDYEKKAYQSFDQVEKYILLENKSIIDNLKQRFAEWAPIREEEISFLRQNNRARAIEIIKEKGIPVITKLTAEMKSLGDFAAKKAELFLKQAHHSEESSYVVVGIIDILAVIISLLIAYWITLSITRPVNIAVDVVERLSRGDLAVDIPSYSRDELGKMLAAMKQMAGNLGNQMREVREGISVIAGSAAEISTTTAQLASTTQEVATSVNQVVVSMEEVKQTTELSNEKAKEMAERAKDVVQTSRGGESAVQQTIDLINAIQEQMISIADSVVGLSDQGQSIGEIIAAVDDVADQSRLLAVNASIEAVKAGEQGKGFTVVADEIKSLAQQSKQSTSQVRTILTDIQKATGAAVMATEKGSKAVENGVKQACQTSSAIRTLGENINQTAQTATQIEATSRQQSAGIDQVFSAMESIGSAITQNAESARQLEKSAHDLDHLGKKLKAIVEKYNV
jgi:methyl-accepting chemotaxis protein